MHVGARDVVDYGGDAAERKRQNLDTFYFVDAFGGGGRSVYIERHRCTRSLSLQQTLTDSNYYAAKQNDKRRPRLGKVPDRILVNHSTRTSSCARALRPKHRPHPAWPGEVSE